MTIRFLGRAALFLAILSLPGVSAHAQYRYPGGYSGWNGWGGGASSLQGSVARGMGVYAAGAGAYNQQTAQARAINANTAMQMNEYMYAVNSQKAQRYSQQQAAKIRETSETADTTYKRLHDNPSSLDIHTGDALNIVLDELTNPKVYTQVVQKATQPIASGLVKNIVFEYAPGMIAISLDDLSSRGVPDSIMNEPNFADERAAVRAVVEKAKQETSSPGQMVSPETLRNGRVAIKALQDKVDAAFAQGTRQRDEADNFLKALYGLTKMLESPDISQFLKGLDSQPTTSLGHLVTFMHTFNLRFGVSKTPDQGAAYDQLYPLLVTLRDQANAQGSYAAAGSIPLPSPTNATTFFSGMHFNHFQPQPGPAPAPPAPGNPM